MRMKEDAMLNGQLKPAYNLQHGVDSEYITWLDISSPAYGYEDLDPIPERIWSCIFRLNIRRLWQMQDMKVKRITCFSKKTVKQAYIKPQNYEIPKPENTVRISGGWKT